MAAWLEMVRQDQDWTLDMLLDRADQGTLHALRGLTCADIELVSPFDIVQVMAAYNAIVHADHPHRLKTFPLSLRRCAMKKVRTYLEYKRILSPMDPENEAFENLANFLSVSDVRSLSGQMLTGKEF